MASEPQAVAKKAVSIVPYLKLPESPGEPAYLIGSRCQHCGEVYLGKRAICIKCYKMDQMQEIALSRRGEVFTFTIVHQSAPWVKVPYVAAVVRLPEGPVVSAVLADCEPTANTIRVGMSVEMVTEKVREDDQGNDVIAYSFRPVRAK